MQSIVCGVPACVSVSLTKPNKQTSQTNPFPPPLQANKQTDSAVLVCFQLFAFLCHIFISSRKVSPAVCQLFCAIDSAPDTSACNIDCHLQAGRQAVLQLTACLPIWHVFALIAEITFSFDCISFFEFFFFGAAFWLPHLLCRVWLLHIRGRISRTWFSPPHHHIWCPSKFAFLCSAVLSLYELRVLCVRACQLATRRIHNAPNDVSSTAKIIAFYGFSIAAIWTEVSCQWSAINQTKMIAKTAAIYIPESIVSSLKTLTEKRLDLGKKRIDKGKRQEKK